MRNLQHLRDSVSRVLWDYELKQHKSDLKLTNSYRDELKETYSRWLKDFLVELEDTLGNERREYVAATLLLLGRQIKELQRTRLLEAFELGLGGDPASPHSLEELANFIKLQENFVDTSLIPDLETHFLDKLDELEEMGQEDFEESLVKKASRVALYTGAFWAVLQGVRKWISGTGRKVTWNTQEDVSVCVDCERLSKGDWVVATLPTTPAMGDTLCKSNCRCWLTFEDPLEIEW